MHAISAVKGFVHDGGDEFGGSPDGGDADEGGSGTIGERRMSRKRRRERERKRKIATETECVVDRFLCIFMMMVYTFMIG